MQRIAGGLAALGVGRGDTSALMLANRPEFHLVDTAAMHLGATPFSIYNTSAPEQIELPVRQRRATASSSPSGSSSTAIAPPRVEPTSSVCVDGAGRDAALDELERAAPGFDFEAAWRAVEPDDVADADLHVGHDRPAEGRRAHPRAT